jgi:hypothetical protein
MSLSPINNLIRSNISIKNISSDWQYRVRSPCQGYGEDLNGGEILGTAEEATQLL